MFSKLLAVAQTKVGAALVAAVLVAGGGTAVAVTATNGALPNLGAHLSGDATHAGDNGTPDGKSKDGNHLSIEGTLQSYTAPSAACGTSSASSATPGSISVMPQGDSSDSQGDSKDSTPEAEGTHTSSHTTSASAVSVSVTCDTRVNGEHASSLADLANAVGHKVQVQATKQGDAWVATKVTVEGNGDSHEGQEPTETSGSGDQHEGQEPTETSDGGDHHGGTPGPEPSRTPDD
jgi:hypothetical protein